MAALQMQGGSAPNSQPPTSRYRRCKDRTPNRTAERFQIKGPSDASVLRGDGKLWARGLPRAGAEIKPARTGKLPDSTSAANHPPAELSRRQTLDGWAIFFAASPDWPATVRVRDGKADENRRLDAVTYNSSALVVPAAARRQCRGRHYCLDRCRPIHEIAARARRVGELGPRSLAPVRPHIGTDGPHFVHTMRGPNDRTVTSPGKWSTFMIT
jgi:hypothetical protein